MRPAPSAVLTYLLLAFGLYPFVPWDPITSTDYYEYSMHLAAAHGWQFGTDFVGTYGPLGFLALPVFHHDTFARLIAANIIVYAAATLWLRRYWQEVGGAGRAPAVWSVLVLVLPAFMSSRVYAAALYAPFVLANAFVVRHFLAGANAPAVDEALMIVFLAACCLVKPPLAVIIVGGVAIVAADQAVTRRRFPWQGPLLIATLLLGWWACGQQFAHIARYLATTSEIAAGYKDAMSLRSPKSDALALVFVAAGAVVLGVLVRATWTRLRWRSLGPAAMFALTVLIVFQHGFTRADEDHILPACLALAALSLGILPVLPRGRSWKQLSTVVATASVLVLVACWRLGFGMPPVSRILAGRASGLWSLMTGGTSSLQRAVALRSEQLGRDNPLRGLREPIDASAVNVELATANHLATMARPTVVMYSAYTPRLSRLNRAYIESAAGPATILLPNDVSLNDRYPTVTDSLSLLGLKSHFELAGRADTYLILQRRAHPLSVQLIRVDERRVAFDETVPVPDHGSDLLWVEIDLRPTTAGWLFGMAYQPAPAYITVNSETATGTFQLTTAMARAGMILAPLQAPHQGLEWLYGSPPRRAAEARSFRLSLGPGLAWCYRASAAVAFFRVVVSTAGAGTPDLTLPTTAI